MIAGRSIALWLVLGFIAFGVFGTVSNLGKSLTGAVTYSATATVFAIAMCAAGIWALTEIWQRGPRRVMSVAVNLGLYCFYYGSIIAAMLSRGDSSNATTWLIVAAPVVGIWALIYWYIGRTVKAEAKQ